MKKNLFFLMLSCFLAAGGLLHAQTALPYSYGFEDEAEYANWTRTNCNTSSKRIGGQAIHSGSWGFQFQYSNTTIQYLVSPELTGVTGGLAVEFYYKAYNTQWFERFRVGYSTTTNVVGAFTWSEQTSTVDTVWHQYTIECPAGTKYLAIECGMGGYYLFLDDFTFTDIPLPTPSDPTGDGSRGLHVVSLDGSVVDEINIGPRPAGTWMEPFHFKMFNDTTTAITVSVLDFTPNNGLLAMDESTELPLTIAPNDTIDLYIATTIGEDVAAGDYPYDYVAIYENSRLAKIWPLVLSVYTPEIPDVVELAYELNDGNPIQPGFSYVGAPAEITPTELHDDYTLPYPWIPEGVDGVYKMTFDKSVMLSARVSDGEDGKVALYLQEGDELPHPMADNFYNSSAYEAHPEPVYSWFNGYSYSGNNTWYGTSAGGGYYFGYRLSAAVIAELGIADASLVTVKAAAREAYPYDLYVFRGGTTPGNAQLIYTQQMGYTPTAMYFFTMPINAPFVLGSEDIWVIFYSDSPYAAYLGRTPDDTENAKLWSMNPNATTPAWTSNTNYPPIIYCELMQYPGGRRVALNLANMRLEDRGNGVYSEVGEMEGEVRGVSIAERRNGMRNPVCGPEIDSLRVDPGTYYLVASSTTPDFEVTIGVSDVPCAQSGMAIYPEDDADDIEPASVTLKWQLDPYATEWRLVFGSTYWPDNEPNHPYTTITEWSDDLSVTSYTLTNLRNNTNYFWRIDQRNNGGDDNGGCTTTGEVWGFTTHLNKPHNLVANPANIYEGQTTTLAWTTIEDRTFRQYNIYKDGEWIGNTQETPYPNVHLNYTVPATELAYNPAGYTFNVTAVYDEGESGFSNSVTVKVAGYSASNGINGYVYEQDGTTPIGGVTVTVTGIDEFGIPHTYNFVTNADGYYEGQVLVGTYTTAIATCQGYQDAEPYQNGPTFAVAYQGSHDDMNFIMDEVFCPPFQVWAEYTYVNGEELVKVWWEPCHSDDIRGEEATRALDHYRVYRTDCYNDGPYTVENTILLSTVWVPDTAYVDVSWPDAAPGVYKWGVGAVYAGNNPNNPNNPRESAIRWADSPRSGNEELPEEGEFVEGISGTRAPWDLLHSFETTTSAQYGVASDGNFIYTCAWSSTPGNQFYKYDLEGNFIEAFDIDGVGYLRDMTYDGQFFYGSDNSPRIYCLDLANHALVQTINTQMTQIRHCSYDPVNDGFWVGNWSDLYRIDRAGSIVATGPALTQCSGSAYYTAEDGSAHLYLFRNINNQYGYVFDYDIANDVLGTEYIFDFTVTPGYSGTSTCGGAFIGEYNGKVAFFGDMQASPNLIGIYELHDMPTPPGPDQGTFNELALPRESLTVWSNCLDKDMYIPSFDGDEPVSVNVLLNSADSPEGTIVSFTNLNEYEQQQYGIEPLELDDSGHYIFESFRRGRYAIEVYHLGYYTIHDTVNIGFEPDDTRELRYVMEEILYPVRDLYVSYTGTAIWSLTEGWEGEGGGNGGGGNGGGGSTETVVLFEDDFENGIGNWTRIDADGDDEQWDAILAPITPALSGANVAASFSWDWYSFDPDNWLISPLVEGATSIHYYMSTNTVFTDHYGVFASSTGTNIADFSLVFDETPFFAKNGGKAYTEGGRDDRPQSEWLERTVELPAGTKYVAFRHYNSANLSNILLEDVTIYGSRSNGRNVAQDRHLQFYKVMCTSIDGEPIFSANTDRTLCVLDTENLVEGETYLCKVAAMFSTGLSEWTETAWVYQSCENYEGTVNGVIAGDGIISWTYPGGTPNPNPNPNPNPGASGWLTYMPETFEPSQVGVAGAGIGTPIGWAMMIPADQLANYVGSNLTKVATYGVDGSGFTATVAGDVTAEIYLGGNTAPQGNPVSTVTFNVPGTENAWVEATLANPVAIDGTQNLWVVFQSDCSTASHPAPTFNDVAGTVNNRWLYYGGSWVDLASAGITGKMWAVRAYVDGGAKGSLVEITHTLQGGNNRPTATANGPLTCVQSNNYVDPALTCDLTTNAGETAATVGDDRAMWDLITTFNAAEGAQYGVASDGNYIYTSNWGWSDATHNFYKYDMEGQMIEGFDIAGSGTFRGIAYDGQYFYGAANSSTVYCVDLANHTLVSTFTTAYGAIRGITYDSERDGFWVVGNWSGNLSLIDRNGTVQFASNVARTDISDIAYFKDDSGVEHIYIFCQPGGSGAYVYDYNIADNILSADAIFDFFGNTPGATGSSGGCFVGPYGNGIAFFGDCQQTPNLIGIYELTEGTIPVPEPEPIEGIVGAAIFLNGELIDIVPSNVNTYPVDGDPEAYCVRIIHDGPMDGTYFSMSCPECAGYNEGGITAIDESSDNVALYPNPTKGNVKIEANGMKRVTVVNTLGQVVYDANANGDEMELNMAQWNTGMYVVRIVTESGIATRRVTVVR